MIVMFSQQLIHAGSRVFFQTACSAGQSSDFGASACTDCSPGTYSYEGSATCEACLPGSFNPDHGGANSDACQPCAAGSAAPHRNMAACTVWDPTIWTVLQHDGPDYLGLWYNALPEHQMALIASGCVPFRSALRGRTTVGPGATCATIALRGRTRRTTANRTARPATPAPTSRPACLSARAARTARSTLTRSGTAQARARPASPAPLARSPEHTCRTRATSASPAGASSPPAENVIRGRSLSPFCWVLQL